MQEELAAAREAIGRDEAECMVARMIRDDNAAMIQQHFDDIRDEKENYDWQKAETRRVRQEKLKLLVANLQTMEAHTQSSESEQTMVVGTERCMLLLHLI